MNETLQEPKRTVRLITYAWGEQYVDDIISLTLPAVLAPGNLPYLSSQTECEFVILTEERFFSKVGTAPVVSNLRKFCPVRFLGLDDLIAAPRSYGMSLTYALHRGFKDLGLSMTETYLIFLNADFIVADGSFRNLYARFLMGERLIASPSYCVIASDVLPELRRRVDPESLVLSIPAREMAGMILKHRHNTIRGKTVNQADFSIFYMDQFYWEVDSNTVVGHQMPVAIVGMRPERHVTEPNSFWDHGLMQEFCPDAAVDMLGDSDEFLMLELRDKDVAKDQIVSGWASAAEIGKRMILWLTSYQRSFSTKELTLHASDIPDAVVQARKKLRAFVDEVLSYTPERLPSHLDHLQWNHHWPLLMAARHKYLSDRLGLLTEMPPPSSLFDIDKCWWELDGLQKKYARKRADIWHHFFQETPTMVAELGSSGWEVYSSMIMEKWDGSVPLTVLTGLPAATAVGKSASPYYNSPSALFLEQLRALDLEFGAELYERNKKYELMMRKQRPGDAPHIKRQPESASILGLSLEVARQVVHANLHGVRQELRRVAVATARRLYRFLYGYFPHVTMLNAHWAPLRPLSEILNKAFASRSHDILLVGDHSKLGNSLDSKLGLLFVVSSAGLLAKNFSQAITPTTKFDLCLCDLSFTELSTFSEFYQAVEPHMRQNGVVVGFHLNADAIPLPLFSNILTENLGDAPVTVVHYSGSPGSAAVLQAYHRARGAEQLSPAESVRRYAIRLPWLTIRVLFTNLVEHFFRRKDSSISSGYCTSITVEVHLPRAIPDDVG